MINTKVVLIEGTCTLWGDLDARREDGLFRIQESDRQATEGECRRTGQTACALHALVPLPRWPLYCLCTKVHVGIRPTGPFPLISRA